jgi:RHS repeat-associated protein
MVIDAGRSDHRFYIWVGGVVRTPAVTYIYGQLQMGYYNKGRLTEVRTDAVSPDPATGVQAVPQTVQAYDYDLMGRIVSQQQTVGTHSYPLSYAYNLLGQLTSETYPSGRIISYEYDEGARLKNVGGGSAGNYASLFVYQAHGGLSAMTFGNGAVQHVSYNERAQPTHIKLTVAGMERQRFDYQYGVVNLSSGTVEATKNTGQVARVEDWIDGVRQWQQRFAYDSLGRLDIASEHKGSNLEQQSWSADYDYDRWGNRYQSGGQNQNLAYVPLGAADINPQNNQFLTNTSYDEAGNVTEDEKFRAQQYRYDGNGRQVWTGQLHTSIEGRAVYDGLGQRVQSVENGTTKTLVYDIHGQVVAEYGGEDIGTGGTHYMMADVQGSTRLVMQCNGAIAARLDYQPFGEEIASDTELRTAGRGYGSVDSTRQRYAGMERDESGLDHTLWRKYESRAGRWTTPDPYGGSMQTGDPQSFNRYAYVGNDPVNFTDPSGLIGIPLVHFAIPPIGPPPSWVDVPISFDSSGVLGAVTGDGRLRPHIWSELEQRGRIPQNSEFNTDELKKEFYKRYQKEFNRCVWKVFGTDIDGNSVNLARFVQRQTNRNAPDVDMTREFGAQGSYEANRGVRGTILISPSLRGWTLNSGQVVSTQEQWFRTYGHELANLIVDRRFGEGAALNLLGTREGIKGDVNVSNQTDSDVGARVEKCMFGNVAY